MAYSRPAFGSRSPHESERSRPSWEPPQRQYYPTMASPSQHNIASPNLFDPESETSDVSDAGEDYSTRVHSSYPLSLPPPPSKQLLESPDAVETRLRELQRVEEHNIKKQNQLKVKRQRKDDRIRRKREEQDAKIKAIMDARARRDDRISRRRKTEDDAFERFDQDLEEEENGLRRRLKRLKRGLPVEDVGLGSRISSASMSPPGPPYHNIPPPPKRHQTGPPGQNNSPVTSTPRPTIYSAPAAPVSTGPNPPPYAFLQSSHPPTSAPYGRSPTISNSPASQSSAFQPAPRPHGPPEPASYNLNGHPPSPHIQRPSGPPATSLLNTAPPPRSTSTSYDTRPPPVSSGFATINTPVTSGFAPINPRSTATPPAPASVPLAKSAEPDRNNGHVRPYASEGTPTGGSNAASTKRTPSTTHPYQMSEAFANRHHHCERVDQLNRGIWTSFGPGGTKEIPTGPPQEMYLRCNHDGCRRIDWRTVHGLQCHIVKNHEQPKGTIGSLEKALDRYGVPVAEVEAYERQHGDGTGGTMADPKNLKLKMKSRESTERAAEAQRRAYGYPSNPTVYHTNVAASLENSASTQLYQGSPNPIRGLQHEDTEDSETEMRNTPTHPPPKPTQPLSRFAAVNGSANGSWSTVPVPKPMEPKDHEMKDAPTSSPVPGMSSVPKRDSTFWRTWSEKTENVKAESDVRHLAPTSTASSQIPPTSNPLQPSQQSANNTPYHKRSSSAQITQSPITPASVVPPAPTQPVNKQDQSPLGPSNKEIQPPTQINTHSTIQPQPKPDIDRPVLDTQMTGGPEQNKLPVQSSIPTKEKEVVSVVEVKEPEKPKAEIVEPNRLEPKSPEIMTRRSSIVGVRRGSSRRSSVAASRAEKEREKEREEAAAAAAARAEAEAEAEKGRERALEREREREREREKEKEREKQREGERSQQEKEELQKKIEAGANGDIDREGEQGKYEDSDDPDTITAAVSSSVDKDKDKDKDRDGKESKTTPRRLANGRFVRKR